MVAAVIVCLPTYVMYEPRPLSTDGAAATVSRRNESFGFAFGYGVMEIPENLSATALLYPNGNGAGGSSGYWFTEKEFVGPTFQSVNFWVYELGGVSEEKPKPKVKLLRLGAGFWIQLLGVWRVAECSQTCKLTLSPCTSLAEFPHGSRRKIETESETAKTGRSFLVQLLGVRCGTEDRSVYITYRTQCVVDSCYEGRRTSTPSSGTETPSAVLV